MELTSIASVWRRTHNIDSNFNCWIRIREYWLKWIEMDCQVRWNRRLSFVLVFWCNPYAVQTSRTKLIWSFNFGNDAQIARRLWLIFLSVGYTVWFSPKSMRKTRWKLGYFLDWPTNVGNKCFGERRMPSGSIFVISNLVTVRRRLKRNCRTHTHLTSFIKWSRLIHQHTFLDNLFWLHINFMR